MGAPTAARPSTPSDPPATASLRSPAALHALRRAAFARYAPARAALRRALEALLFDEADLYAAVSISAEAELTVDLSAATPLSSLSPRSLHIG